MVELPYGRKADFEYFIYFVGPGLRPDRPESCYFADMCMPIFPNTSHPSGRLPVRPVADFPYSNCYQWFCSDMQYNVRIKNEKGQFGMVEKVPDFIQLPVEDYVTMEMEHQLDVDRILLMRKEKESEMPPPHTPVTSAFSTIVRRIRRILPASKTPEDTRHGVDHGEEGDQLDDDYSEYSGDVPRPRDQDSDVSSLPSGPENNVEEEDSEAEGDSDSLGTEDNDASSVNDSESESAEVRSMTES